MYRTIFYVVAKAKVLRFIFKSNNNIFANNTLQCDGRNNGERANKLNKKIFNLYSIDVKKNKNNNDHIFFTGSSPSSAFWFSKVASSLSPLEVSLLCSFRSTGIQQIAAIRNAKSSAFVTNTYKSVS